MESGLNLHLSNYMRTFQVALVVKNPPANAGDIRDAGLIPGSGRSPKGEYGNTLQYSCLENLHGLKSLAEVHRVTKSWPRLKRLSMHAVTYVVEHLSKCLFATCMSSLARLSIKNLWSIFQIGLFS